MADRPTCIVRSQDAPTVDRAAASSGDGVDFRVRPLSDVAGLTRMGVKIREIPPGRAGTHFHFHDVEEEWAFVLSGRGRVRIGPMTLPVSRGSFVAFPPGPRPHHFVAEGADPLILLEGGERRRDTDSCTYPELGVRVRQGRDEKIDPAALPAFEGDASQLLQLENVEEIVRPHPLTPTAIRHQRGLDPAIGMQRQGVSWARLEPETESTTFHTHERTDEWVYLLSGEADVRLGSEWHAVCAGDFIGHPAKGPAHVMRARSEVTYLMGGERNPEDIVLYPEVGMRLTSAGFEKVPT